MAEYIEREKLLEILRYRGTQYAPKPFEGGFVSGWHEAIDEIESDVEDIPAADVRPERHGEWKKYKGKRERSFSFICSECNSFLPFTSKFCPRCGAKMDGEDGNNDLH